jgi:hypothetical protein
MDQTSKYKNGNFDDRGETLENIGIAMTFQIRL